MNKKMVILSLAFFLSGASAILYEVLWIRLLSLAFGGVTLTTGVVTALFLTGLALGAFLGGKFIDRFAEREIRRLLLFYLVIELFIALLGIINWQAFSYFSLTPGNWRYLTASLLILLQTTIIGTTWPLMFKIFLGTGSQWRIAGLITFLNTLGGAFGALFASFFLMANIGVAGTLLTAGVGNALAGLLVGLLSRRNYAEIPIHEDKRRSLESRLPSLMITLALFGAGFLGMALEIFWMRSFGLILGSSIYSFTLVLFAILLGLAFGGIIINRWDEKISANTFVWFFYISSLLIFLGLVFLPKTPWIVVWWFERFGKTFVSFQILGVFVVSSVVLLPSIVSGIIFAKGVVLLKDAFDIAGRKAGLAYFANTLGGVLGGIVSALFLLTWLGLREGIVVLGSLGILIYLSLLIFTKKFNKSFFIWPLIPLTVASWGLVNWDKRVMSSGAWLYGGSVLQKTAGIRLLSYQDGRESTVTTTWQEGTTALLINGKPDASSDVDMGTQAILGHVPVLLHLNPKNVLVIGLGSGITAGAISTHRKVENLTVVEIEPAVVEVARRFFPEENYRVLDNPKVNLVVGDARNYLLETSQKFEMITSEPSNPWIAGEANLFTQEFFEIGKKHLSEEGVFFQWLHLYNLSPHEVKAIIATFHSVFPYVQLWTSTNPADIFLAGKTKPFTLSWDRFEEGLDNSAVIESLKRRGFADEVRLLSLIWARTNMVGNLTKGGEINTDKRPILEYKAPFGLFTNSLPDNFSLLLDNHQDDGSVLEIIQMPQEVVDKFTRARQARYLLVRSRQAAENGEFEKAIALAEEGLAQDSEAPSVKSLLAELYLKKGESLPKDQKPETYFQKAIELNPNLYQSYLKLAQIYLTGNQTTEAEKLLGEAVKRFPWSGQLLMFQGVIAGMKGREKEAEELLLKAKDLEPWNVLIYNNLAHLYNTQGRRDLAMKEWEASLSLEPNQPKIREFLQSYQRLKNLR